jgi:hypothetical protein
MVRFRASVTIMVRVSLWIKFSVIISVTIGLGLWLQLEFRLR